MLLFELFYDPAAWQLETVLTPGGLGYQLAHRQNEGCLLSQTTGGNASLDMTVEYRDEMLGNAAYYIGEATQDAELAFVTYCTSYADTPTCFIAYPGEAERRCLAEVEGMLAGVTFLTNPRYTSAPNLWACRDQQNNPGLCQVSYTQPVNALSLPAEGVGWVAGEQGFIHRWENEVEPVIAGFESVTYYDLFFVDQAHGWFAGSRGLILAWDGENWTVQHSYTAPEDDPTGAAQAIYALDFSALDDGWAAGATAYADGHAAPLLLHWNGLRWLEVTDLPECTACAFNAVLALNSRDLWLAGGGKFCQETDADACADRALLWHWDGNTWTSFAAPGASWLYALAQAPAGELWAAGIELALTPTGTTISRGAVLQFTGSQWTPLSLPPHSGGIYALATLADGSLVVGGDVTLLRSSLTWTYITSEIVAYGSLTDLETGVDGELYALTSSGFLFKFKPAP